MLENINYALFALLKKLRGSLAAAAGVPAYVVFTDAALRDMCAKKPQTEQEFLQVSGVGERKAARGGNADTDAGKGAGAADADEDQSIDQIAAEQFGVECPFHIFLTSNL